MSVFSPLQVKAMTAVSAIGKGLAETLSSLNSQKSGLSPCDFETVVLATYIGKVAGLDSLAFPKNLAKFDCRNNRLALLTLMQDDFIEEVKLMINKYGANRIGVFLGTSTSGILQTEIAYRHINTATNTLANEVNYEGAQNTYSVASFVREYFSLSAPALVVSTACSSSAKVFGVAQRYINQGLVDAAIVGGVDSLCLTTLYGFNSLQLLAANNCRPFASDRNGINIGEAGAFALVSRNSAAEDNNQLLIKAVGESSDGHHMSAPHPQGLGAQLAMQNALQQAGLTALDIDYINLHGTATLNNDAAEGLAVANLFADKVLASATKGVTGHTLGAAGGLELVISALAIKTQTAWGGSANAELDKTITINYLQKNKKHSIRNVISNSFGFGGSNCCLLIGK